MSWSHAWLVLLGGGIALGLVALAGSAPAVPLGAPLAQATATNTLTPTATLTPTVTLTPTRTPRAVDRVFNFQGAEDVPFRAVSNGDGTYSLGVVVVTPVP